jgi:hypothetical protein
VKRHYPDILQCHERSKAKPQQMAFRERAFLGFAGALVTGWGVVTLLQGKLHYQNYWHGSVFAPFSVIIGALILFVAIKGGRS